MDVDGKCCVCAAAQPKYRCPACSKQTCSLNCVRQHKVDDRCDGLRKKTDFVAIKDYSDINLLSDYRFLEDVGRKADAAIRTSGDFQTRQNCSRHKFRQQCKTRDVTFLPMPRSMSRHKQNRSYFHAKSSTIHWTVEFVFPQADAKYTRKVTETCGLGDQISGFIDPGKSDPVIRQKLRPYEHPGINNVSLFMKVEGRSADSVRYYKLDKDKTVRENLSGKVIIEFPTIFCVICYCCQPYTVLEEDEKPDVSVFTSLREGETSASSQRGRHRRSWHGQGRGGKWQTDGAPDTSGGEPHTTAPSST